MNTHKIVMTVKSSNPLVHAMILGSINPKNNKDRKTVRILKKFLTNLNREFDDYKRTNPEARMIPMMVYNDTTEIELWCDEGYANHSMEEYNSVLPKLQLAIGKMIGIFIGMRIEKL